MASASRVVAEHSGQGRDESESERRQRGAQAWCTGSAWSEFAMNVGADQGRPEQQRKHKVQQDINPSRGE